MTSSIDGEASETSRDRILRIFGYLKALHDHRNPAKRHIRDHSWHLWYRDLPEHPSITRVFRRQKGEDGPGDVAGGDDGAVLRVRRPMLTSCPTPPEAIRSWLRGGWEDPDIKSVRWLEEVNDVDEDGETVVTAFEDDPERVEALKQWREERERWRANELPARQAMKVFERMHALHGRLEREAENLELVLGDGVLSWNGDDGGIFHPLLIQRVQLQFDSEEPEFTVRDADFGVEFYSSIFQSVTDVDPKALGKCRDELADTVYHPLDEDAGAFLNRVALTLSSQGEVRDNERPEPSSDPPVIGRSPVLFLRSRAYGFANAIDKTVERLGKRPDLGDALRRIAGDHTGVSRSDATAEPKFRDGSERRPPAPEILLGKPANVEQAQIAERLECHGSVLVQGPPGTGKSHTIGNLVGHLLSEGKTVLVTSHTTKALRVLRKHVVPKLQPLCVSVLENDLDSQRQLEESVQTICQRLSDSDPSMLDGEAEQFTTQRKDLLRKRQELETLLLKARTQEYQDIVFAGESIAPSAAAKEVAAVAGTDDWVPGPVAANQPLPLSPQEVVELYRTNATTHKEDEEKVDQPFPPLASVVAPESFAALVKHSTVGPAHRVYRASEHLWQPEQFTTKHLQLLPALIAKLKDALAHFQTLDLWKIAAVDAGRHGGADLEPWRLLTEKIRETAQLASETKLARIQHKPQVGFTDDLPEQLRVAEEISQHFAAGKSLNWWTLLCNPRWKECIAQWSVHTGTPSTREHIDAILGTLRLEIARQELSVLWAELMEKYNAAAVSDMGHEPESVCEQHLPAIETALLLWSTKWQPLISELQGLSFDWEQFLAEQPVKAGPFGALRRQLSSLEERLIPLLEATEAVLRCKYYSEQLRKAAVMLSQFERDEVRRLRTAAAKREPAEYAEAYEVMRRAAERQEHAKRRRLLLQKLERPADGEPVAGAWAAPIRAREGVHGEPAPPGDPVRAWRWRQLHDEIQRRLQIDVEGAEQQKEVVESQLRRATVNLIDRRAWTRQVRTSANLKQDLVGWLDIRRKIGKGYGKRAAQLRLDARRKMRECREAVPVWIMPLARVVDSFDFAKTQFDVVIIDEASQCDVMGLLALALGKQVVVVGDNEQVSPSAVGQKLDVVTNLIRMHLDGVPNSTLYDGQTSIYDLARQSFSGQICLKEHFRCATDIIQFSNYLCYGGEIKPLRDNPKLDDQIVSHRVEGAVKERQVNEVEAEEVASLLVAATEHEAYAGLTFGVISMIGDDQAYVIEELLRRYLTTEEFEDRRILCGKAAQFQGDERDVVFLSLVDASKGSPLRLTQARTYQQRFNVAASRAKEQLWVVHSMNPATDLKEGDLRKRLIDHATDPKALTRQREQAEARAESPFEAAVSKRLIDARFSIVQQWKVGVYRIDIVVQDDDKKLAVECDGDRFHPPEKLSEDMERQAILERLGWRFHRIRGSEFFYDPDRAMEQLFARLRELEISPVADTETPIMDRGAESVTDEIVRRAAEIRNAWRNGEDWTPLEVMEELHQDGDAPEPPSQLILDEVGADGSSEHESDEAADDGQLVWDWSEVDTDFEVHLETSSDSSLRDQILQLLQSSPGLRAREIASELGLDRRQVNSLLHGIINHQVSQDADHRWYATSNGETA